MIRSTTDRRAPTNKVISSSSCTMDRNIDCGDRSSSSLCGTAVPLHLDELLGRCRGLCSRCSKQCGMQQTNPTLSNGFAHGYRDQFAKDSLESARTTHLHDTPRNCVVFCIAERGSSRSSPCVKPSLSHVWFSGLKMSGEACHIQSFCVP